MNVYRNKIVTSLISEGDLLQVVLEYLAYFAVRLKEVEQNLKGC